MAPSAACALATFSNSGRGATTAAVPATAELPWGSYHCRSYRDGGKCDVCDHMVETTVIGSEYFGMRLKIHGHLRHDWKPAGGMRWFVYLVQDLPCGKQYVGSTQNVSARWSGHKHSANFPEGKDPLHKKTPSTGLAKHFQKGCPNDLGPTKHTLSFSLLDYYDTSQDLLPVDVRSATQSRISRTGGY